MCTTRWNSRVSGPCLKQGYPSCATPIPQATLVTFADDEISWDAAYTTEIQNHTSDSSDIGHSWFSESDAEGRVSRYLETLSDESVLDVSATSFLDLGTGNGSMLFALRDDDWQGEMLGVDYSEASVELARRVEKQRLEDSDEPTAATRFETWDLLGGEYRDDIWPASVIDNEDASLKPESTLHRLAWDVVLDKGTFDAISLSGETDSQGRRIVEGYRDRIKPLLIRGKGLLIITSCNWTQDELIKWFVKAGDEPDGGFSTYGRVKYPSYKFGGQEGQTISTVCFKRT